MSQRIASLHADITANTKGYEQGAQRVKMSLEEQQKAMQSFAAVQKQKAKEFEQSEKMKWKAAQDSAKAQAQAYKEAERQQKAYEKATKDAEKAQKQAHQEMIQGFQKLAITIGIAAVALKKIYDFAEIGAQNKRLADSGAELASQYGASMDEIVRKVSAASLHTVSDLDIIQSANRVMALGVTSDADKMANLMEIAAYRARQMGITSTQAFGDLATGIGRVSPLILDNLGIVTKGWAEEAKAAGVAYDQQFVLNKVLEQGNAQLLKAGGLVADDAAQFEILEAGVKNNTDRLKEYLATAVVPLIENINKQNTAMETELSLMDETAKSLGMTTEEFIKWGNAQHDGFVTADMAIETYRETKVAMDAITEATENQTGALQENIAMTEEQIEALQKANEATLSGAMNIKKSQDDYIKSQQAVGEKIAELQAQKAELYPWETQKIDEVNQKIAEQEEAYQKNADNFVQASQQKIAQMAIEKIAMQDGVQGFSDAEMEMAAAIAENFDLATRQTIEQQLAQEKLTSAVADGSISVEEFGQILKDSAADGVISLQEVEAAMNRLQNKTVTVTVVQNLVNQGVPSYVAQNYAVPHATGGDFLIPQSYGNEGFKMGNGDTASGGERITITPANQAGSGSQTTTAVISDSSMDRFINRIEAALQRVGK